MAPEIVSRNVCPNTQTDRFSLAVILFLILCMNHPLEGKKVIEASYPIPLLAEKIYGSEALFIYDPNDNSNAPHEKIHANVVARWEYFPDYIKAAFLKAFSQQAIKKPEVRLRELDWLKVLTRFRSDIVRCGCGNEVFVKNAETTRCDRCGRPVLIHHAIALPEYAITAVRDSRIYRCQLEACNDEDALELVVLVGAKSDDPTLLGLKNMTNQMWTATTTVGNKRQVMPQEIVPFKSGISIEIYSSNVVLK